MSRPIPTSRTTTAIMSIRRRTRAPMTAPMAAARPSSAPPTPVAGRPRASGATARRSGESPEPGPPIAGAASKDRRDGDYRYEPPYPDEPNDDGYYVDPPQDARAYDGAYGSGKTEQRAADACSWATEGELGNGAQVESITGTRPDQGYGWYVAGTVSRPGEPLRSFGCTYQNGRATDVRFN